MVKCKGPIHALLLANLSEAAAYSFLHVLNDLHPSISFTMELPSENTLPFLGMVLRKQGQNITTSVYVKPANTRL